MTRSYGREPGTMTTPQPLVGVEGFGTSIYPTRGRSSS
jgi:hypothetical protein